MNYEVYDNKKELIIEGTFKDLKEIKETLKDYGYFNKFVTVYNVSENRSKKLKLK